jgi:hypothetical protein
VVDDEEFGCFLCALFLETADMGKTGRCIDGQVDSGSGRHIEAGGANLTFKRVISCRTAISIAKNVKASTV